MAPERLNADWILDWLKKPSDILPGTRMPAFWPHYPKSLYTHDLKDFGWLPPSMDGNAEAQIRAIRDHILRGQMRPGMPLSEARAMDRNLQVREQNRDADEPLPLGS